MSCERHRRGRSDDRGLTLVELVVVVTILGLVMTALTGAIVIFLRTETDPGNRLDKTRGLQQLVNYFPADVASSQIVEDAPPWTEPCLGVGTPIANFVWTESFPGSNTVRVSATYILRSDGSTLIRNTCGSESSTLVVARDLSSASAVVERVTDGVPPAAVPTGRVDLTIGTQGELTVISGTSRNLDAP